MIVPTTKIGAGFEGLLTPSEASQCRRVSTSGSPKPECVETALSQGRQEHSVHSPGPQQTCKRCFSARHHTRAVRLSMAGIDRDNPIKFLTIA